VTTVLNKLSNYNILNLCYSPLEHQYNKESSQAIYKLRKEKVELEESYDFLLDMRMHSYEHQTKFRSDLLSASRIGRSQSRNVVISQLL